MTFFPGPPRLIEGGIVLVDPVSEALHRGFPVSGTGRMAGDLAQGVPIDGLAVGGREGPRIGAALTAEAMRLIAERGLGDRPDRGRALPPIRTEPIARPAGGAAALGRQIGRAPAGGIGQ